MIKKIFFICLLSSYLQVIRIDPSSGKLLQRISFEGLADNITSVAFGGHDLKDLYVTSAMQTNKATVNQNLQKSAIFHKVAQFEVFTIIIIVEPGYIEK